MFLHNLNDKHRTHAFQRLNQLLLEPIQSSRLIRTRPENPLMEDAIGNVHQLLRLRKGYRAVTRLKADEIWKVHLALNNV